MELYLFAITIALLTIAIIYVLKYFEERKLLNIRKEYENSIEATNNTRQEYLEAIKKYEKERLDFSNALKVMEEEKQAAKKVKQKRGKAKNETD